MSYGKQTSKEDPCEKVPFPPFKGKLLETPVTSIGNVKKGKK